MVMQQVHANNFNPNQVASGVELAQWALSLQVLEEVHWVAFCPTSFSMDSTV